MSDQTLAALITAGTIIGLKIVEYLFNFWFPKGRMSKWARDHSVPAEPEDEEG